MLLQNPEPQIGLEDLLVGIQRVERDLAFVVAVAVALVAMLFEDRGNDRLVFADGGSDCGVFRVGRGEARG